MILKRSNGNDIAVARPERRVPFPFFDEIRSRIVDQPAQPRECLAAPIPELVDVVGNSL
jgi:hypothetical protein